MRVVFLHGKESGPNGSKIRGLRAAGWDVLAPDCEGIEDVAQRVAIAREAVMQEPGPLALVGSSMGGLTAALLWSELAEHPEAPRIEGVFLLAPALNWSEAEGIAHVHPNTSILHGVQDDVVPIEASRVFAAAHRCPLLEVDDGHRLAASHPAIHAGVAAIAGQP